MTGLVKEIPWSRSLDGARILYRHMGSIAAPSEGWVKEFSPDGRHVRVSKTEAKTDAGTWHTTFHLKIGAILEPARAAQVPEKSHSRTEPPSVEEYL